MIKFVENIDDKSMREKLSIALDGKGAFRRFKSVLPEYPNYRKKWLEFKEREMEKEIIEWLNSIDFEPVERGVQDEH